MNELPDHVLYVVSADVSRVPRVKVEGHVFHHLTIAWSEQTGGAVRARSLGYSEEHPSIPLLFQFG